LDGVLDMVRACDDMHDADDVIAWAILRSSRPHFSTNTLKHRY
jgi:hypothetical protein